VFKAGKEMRILPSLGAEGLVNVLTKPSSADLSAVLKIKENEILDLLLKNSQQLVAMLTKLQWRDLNEVFKAKRKEIFPSLDAKSLVEVLTGVDFSTSGKSPDLRNLLIVKENGILDFLNKKAKERVSQYLVDVLIKLQWANLDAVFKTKENEILSSLDSKSLVDVLTGFASGMLGKSLALRNLLTVKENGILAFLNDKAETEQLDAVLSMLDATDLNLVLDTQVDERRMRERIENWLKDHEISEAIRTKLTEILGKAGFKGPESEVLQEAGVKKPESEVLQKAGVKEPEAEVEVNAEINEI
jgi:hypothetical protein